MVKTPLNIIVVDDEPELGEVIEYTLVRAGHNVQVMTSPLEALKVLDGGLVDVVLSDYHMPLMSGIDFYRAARKGWGGHFFLLTGETYVDVEALKKIGIKDVLFKPKDLPRLTEMLAALQQSP